MITSPELLSFYKAWLAWAEAGAVTDEFDPAIGLCTNLGTRFTPGDDELWDDDLWDRLYAELGEQLDTLGENNLFPFGGAEEYEARCMENTQHLNPLRLAFVRARIAEAST